MVPNIADSRLFPSLFQAEYSATGVTTIYLKVFSTKTSISADVNALSLLWSIVGRRASRGCKSRNAGDLKAKLVKDRQLMKVPTGFAIK